MFQQNEWIGLAEVLDTHSLPGCLGCNEQFVFRHLAEPDHRGCGYGMFTKRSVSLSQDQPIGCVIANRHGTFWKDSHFFCGVVTGTICNPILAVSRVSHF